MARHRVPRYELVDLLFLRNSENVVQIFEYIYVFKVNICNSNLFSCGFYKRLLNILKTFFWKNLCCYNQWFLDFFHFKDPKMRCIWPRTPISKYVVPGTPQKQRVENVCLKICTHFHDFSKIVDLQAHSAAPSAALRACRSAIFIIIKLRANL